MVWGILGLVAALLGTGIWMAVWVSRLKGAVADERGRASSWEKKYREMELEARRHAGENKTLSAQLTGLRRSYKEVLDAMEAGGGDVSSFAARLRDGMS